MSHHPWKYTEFIPKMRRRITMNLTVFFIVFRRLLGSIREAQTSNKTVIQLMAGWYMNLNIPAANYTSAQMTLSL